VYAGGAGGAGAGSGCCDQVLQFLARLENGISSPGLPRGLRSSVAATRGLRCACGTAKPRISILSPAQRAHHAVEDRIHNHFTVFAVSSAAETLRSSPLSSYALLLWAGSNVGFACRSSTPRSRAWPSYNLSNLRVLCKSTGPLLPKIVNRLPAPSIRPRRQIIGNIAEQQIEAERFSFGG